MSTAKPAETAFQDALLGAAEGLEAPPPRHIPPARFYRNLMRVFSWVGISLMPRDVYETDVRPRKETRFVWVPPAPEDWVEGEWKDWMGEQRGNWGKGGMVKRRRVGAYWWGERMTPPSEKEMVDGTVDKKYTDDEAFVVLFFHGGAYALGSAQEEDITGYIPRGLIKRQRINSVLSIEYRLTGQAPCPAQFLDALAGWHYLVGKLGVPPSRILIVGDSAGGHLATAMTRYLAVQGDGHDWGVPAGTGLLSPWCDWRESAHGPSKAHELIDRFMGTLPVSLRKESAYLSPSCSTDPLVPAKQTGRWPSTLIFVGTDEYLLPSITALHDRLDEAAVDLVFFVSKGSPHDFLATEGLPNIVWGTSAHHKRQQRERGWATLTKWVDQLWAGQLPSAPTS